MLHGCLHLLPPRVHISRKVELGTEPDLKPRYFDTGCRQLPCQMPTPEPVASNFPVTETRNQKPRQMETVFWCKEGKPKEMGLGYSVKALGDRGLECVGDGILGG